MFQVKFSLNEGLRSMAKINCVISKCILFRTVLCHCDIMCDGHVPLAYILYCKNNSVFGNLTVKAMTC